MKKQWLIRACLLIAYCVPFAFLSVNGDATSGTMLFYGVMIAGFALLCWGALKTDNVAVLYIGNILSFASCVRRCETTAGPLRSDTLTDENRHPCRYSDSWNNWRGDRHHVSPHAALFTP